jgi:hypothetical protein
VKRWRDLLLGGLAGIVLCYVAIDWRIGAADAYAQMYAVGANDAFTRLQQCQNPTHQWPRKRL